LCFFPFFFGNYIPKYAFDSTLSIPGIGIVEEITGKARNRIFRYRELPEILGDEKGIS